MVFERETNIDGNRADQKKDHLRADRRDAFERIDYPRRKAGVILFELGECQRGKNKDNFHDWKHCHGTLV